LYVKEIMNIILLQILPVFLFITDILVQYFLKIIVIMKKN